MKWRWRVTPIYFFNSFGRDDKCFIEGKIQSEWIMLLDQCFGIICVNYKIPNVTPVSKLSQWQFVVLLVCCIH